MNNYPRPARKIRNNNGLSKVIGLFSSRKMSAMVPWESQLERDYCYLLEYDKNIEQYFSQPKTFGFIYDGNQIKYTPDFYILYKDKSCEFVEVKFIESLKNEKIIRKLSLITNYFKKQNIKYRIICEDEIRLEPRLKNIKFLYKYSKVPYEKEFKFNVDTTLLDLSELVDVKIIYAAMYHNFIKFDINQELNGSLKLSCGDLNEK